MKGRGASWLLVRCLFLIVAAVVSGGLTRVEAYELGVTGKVRWKKAHGSGSFDKLDGAFEVNVKDGKFLISIDALANGTIVGRRHISGYDGTNAYSLVENGREVKGGEGRRVNIGRVRDGPYPMREILPLRLLWFAFCYTEVDSFRVVESFSEGRLPESEEHGVCRIVERYNESSLLKEAVIAFGKEVRGYRERRRIEYTARGMVEVNGVHLPKEGRFVVRTEVGGGAIGEVRFRVEEALSVGFGGEEFCYPPLEGKTAVVDRRFKFSSLRVDALAYEVTNGVWRKAGNEAVRRLAEEVVSSRKNREGLGRKRNAWLIMLIGVALSAAFVFFRGWHRGKEPKNGP